MAEEGAGGKSRECSEEGEHRTESAGEVSLAQQESEEC